VVFYRVKLDGVAEATRSIERLKEYLRAEPVKLGRQIEREVIKALEALTPQQHNQRFGPSRGQPLHERWGAINIRSSGYRYSSTVRNAADKTGGGIAVLNSLESGAKRHDIYPRNAEVLRWSEGFVIGLFRGRGRNAEGQTLDRFKTRAGRGDVRIPAGMHVNHPGHKAFHMVQRAHDQIVRGVLPVLESQFLDRLVSVTTG
jgi:hypothetical protein